MNSFIKKILGLTFLVLACVASNGLEAAYESGYQTGSYPNGIGYRTGQPSMGAPTSNTSMYNMYRGRYGTTDSSMYGSPEYGRPTGYPTQTVPSTSSNTSYMNY